MGGKQSDGESSHEGRADSQSADDDRTRDGHSEQGCTEQDFCDEELTVEELTAWELIEQRVIQLSVGPDVKELKGEARAIREKEIHEAIELIHRTFGSTIIGSVWTQYPYLSEQDLEDAWVVAIAEFLNKVQRGMLKAEGRSLALLRKIMERRCADLVRSRIRERSRYERYLESVRPQAEETLASQEQIAVVYRLLDEAIKKLPRVQQDVWRAYREIVYQARVHELQALLEKHEPRPEGWTSKAVQRALEEGRKKIKIYLKEHGYDGKC